MNERRIKMTNLEMAKKIISENYDVGDCGLFDSRNIVGDPMTTLYDGNGLTIDICYGYCYFEVFGLTRAEFEDLYTWYDGKRKGE